MNAALRVAIVDDEPLARMRLARMLGEFDDVELVGSYGNGHAAFAGLQESPADALFLDIRMPEVDGFQLLERLPAATRPLVVFVSAYGERALEAFDVEAVDYLVKPLSQQRLDEAVARVRAWLARRLPQPPARQSPDDADARYPKRLAVPDGPRMRMIPVDEIELLVAQGNYVEVVVPGRSLLLREPLTSLARRLDPAMFVRIHRSRVVRIDMIDQVESRGAGQYRLRLKNGTSLTSGRSFRAQLRDALGLAG
ncbi:MAG TPA: LytTR family DNA-binding domain-containing protein [Chiayiivirga sp.]|nr:LytTR family DNA-binding domain-containing protein [Chiayiivirga sp.]